MGYILIPSRTRNPYFSFSTLTIKTATSSGALMKIISWTSCWGTASESCKFVNFAAEVEWRDSHTSPQATQKCSYKAISKNCKLCDTFSIAERHQASLERFSFFRGSIKKCLRRAKTHKVASSCSLNHLMLSSERFDVTPIKSDESMETLLIVFCLCSQKCQKREACAVQLSGDSCDNWVTFGGIFELSLSSFSIRKPPQNFHIFSKLSVITSAPTPIQLRLWLFLCLFLICYSFRLLHSTKTTSDNLGDAIQFLREFDHEAAEMCNR